MAPVFHIHAVTFDSAHTSVWGSRAAYRRESCPSGDAHPPCRCHGESRARWAFTPTSASMQVPGDKKWILLQRSKKCRFLSLGRRISGLASSTNLTKQTIIEYPLPILPTILSAYCKSSLVTSLHATTVPHSFDVKPIQITFRSSPSYCTPHFFAEQQGCWSWAALVAHSDFRQA